MGTIRAMDQLALLWTLPFEETCIALMSRLLGEQMQMFNLKIQVL